jgi:hypothetical protein
MAAKLTRLTHKIAIQLHLVVESCTIYSSSARRPVRKLLDTPSYYPPTYAYDNVSCFRTFHTRPAFNTNLLPEAHENARPVIYRQCLQVRSSVGTA